jgi:hypothetical protein
MIPSPHLTRLGCRFVLKATCIYLIPWAKACDKCAAWLAVRKPSVLKWTWHVAAGLLAVVVIVHLALVSLLIKYMNDGAHTPCVCTASGEPVGRRQDTSSVVNFMASLIHLSKAFLHTLQSGLNMCSDVCLVILRRPRLRIILGSLTALLLSVAL